MFSDNLDKNLVEEAAQKYSLELILLFGSRASGRSHRESDFDVAYLGQNDLSLQKEAELIIDLSHVFKNENIDLVNLKKAPPLLAYAVFQNARVIYEKRPLLYASQRVYAFKKYVESKPLYQERFAKLRERIKSF